MPCPVHSARRAGSLARRTTAGVEMAVVRFVITGTVVKMRITELAIHCNPFIALPGTMQLCLSQRSQMSVFINQQNRVKKHVKINLSFAAKSAVNIRRHFCGTVSNAKVEHDSMCNTWNSSLSKDQHSAEE